MKEKAYQSKPLLTKREREVFELLVQDKTTKEIAGELFISEKTVRNHISNVMWSVCKYFFDYFCAVIYNGNELYNQ
ncbi:helix-turn-helix domain-containing protein [Bacillus thuringiensis]|uniref:helix-turn-helix domain-containing protein n=1 Tax=Bacillus thuringiensis TaxID=1428 RepID=UPI0005CDDF1C|nr:helix-turn-helix transcriptional regulator [Bacillus thuringiensis]